MARTLEIYRKIDILVNNAGVSWRAPAETMPLDNWGMVIDVNLTGAFLFCQAAGRDMIQRGAGRIVNISSINALTGGLIMTDLPIAGYVASKGGLIALTRELAAKWGRHAIRVNAIAPGYFPSRMTNEFGTRCKREWKTSSTGPRRTGGRTEERGSVPRVGSVELCDRADHYRRRRNDASVRQP